ncbi:serine protease [Kitasatospora sp. NPDC058162]|uniref:S1 family peptidase n=1 Tax=Kitasatospora sp. NPDC058162 TaxID=3346362 RepID=UPI0036DDCCEE
MEPQYRSKRDDHRGALLAATVRVSARRADGTEKKTGTGFFVTDNWVLTAAHVVPPNTEAYVLWEGWELPAQVLERKPQNVTSNYETPDVALLSVGTDDEPVPKHGCIELLDLEPALDDELFAYGWPLVEGGPMQEGMVMRYDSTRTPGGGPRLFLTKGHHVQPGSSGAAAIHLDRGVVVGIIKLTRARDWDGGAVLLPTEAVLGAFPDYELAGRNREATATVDSREALHRRFGRVLTRITDALAAAKPEWRRSTLEVLEGVYPPAVSAEDLALKLIDLQLQQLRDPLKHLAEINVKGKGVPVRRLLDATACCAWVRERPWVEPHGAALLAKERRAENPRIVHVPCTNRLTGEMYVGRAASQGDWEVVALITPDAEGDTETDPGTGLPARLLHSIRAELLTRLTPVDSDDRAEVLEMWERRRDDALAQADELLLLLPTGAASQDEGLLRGLRQEFPGCTFAIFASSLTPGPSGFPGLVHLPASLPSEDEERAALWYCDMKYQLKKAAKR